MARYPRAERIYEIAAQFRERCLVEERSLLWPNEHAWTAENIESLRVAMFDNFIPGADQSFTDKLRQQLATTNDDIHRIAVDLNVMYHLYPHKIKRATKIQRVEEVLNWRLAPASASPVWNDVAEAFEVGAGSVGTFYQTRKPACFAYILRLAALCRENRGAAANDDDLISLARQAQQQVPDSIAAHRALMHMLFPERFERTVSGQQRAKIIAAWPDLVAGIDDSDDTLHAIRTELGARFGRADFDFYDELDLRRKWDTDVARDPEVNRIRDFVAATIPDADTRMTILSTFADAITRANAIADSSWALTFPAASELRLIVSSGKSFAIGKAAFWIFLETGQFEAEFPDPGLLDAAGIPIDRSATYTIGLGVPYGEANDWLARLKPLTNDAIDNAASTVRTRSHRHEHHQPAAVTYLNEELDLDLPQPNYGPAMPPAETARWWIERTTTIGWPYRQEGEWSVGKAIFFWPDKIAKGHIQSQMRAGDVVLHFTDQMGFTGISRVQSAWNEEIPTPEGTDWSPDTVAVARLSDYRKISPPLLREAFFDREPFAARLKQLPAQGYRNLFYTTKRGLQLWGSGYLTPVPLPLLDILRAAYSDSADMELVPEGWPMPEGGSDDPIKVLVAKTHMPQADLLELIDLIADKKQLILEGPPGSGKTYLADLLARWIAGVPLEGDDTDRRVELVQFHQSYGYEDFVQGLRPVSRDGQVVFEVVDGIFLEMCTRAASDPDNEYVLIIDEINRGNLSRIFGELLMALEYRDKPVRLPYGAAPLRIPGNLSLIGTMNSTDRSLALIDYALRRRFYFHRLLPVSDGAAPVYRRWLEARVPGAHHSRLHTLFVNLNSRIGERLTPDFQVGHSYFMRDDIHTDAGLNRVWKHAVTPLLQEYFHTTRNAADVLAEFTIDRLLGRQAAAQDLGGGAATADDGQP